MRTIPAALQTHLDSRCTTLAGYLTITRTDAAVYGFTDHDVAVEIGGVSHVPLLGQRSKAAANIDLSIPNFDIRSVIDTDAFTEDDLASGRFDGATVELGLVNWAAPGDGVIVLQRGTMGEVRRAGVAFFADMRGLSAQLDQAIGERTSPNCRAVLGDARCGADLTNFTTTGEVTAVASNRQFTAVFADLPTAAPPPAAGFFDYGGVLTWTGGANDGLTATVRRHTDAGGSPQESTLQLHIAAFFDVQSGDTFSVHAGCNKILPGHCQSRFDNVVNFVGEPHIPGVDVGVLTEAE